MIIKVAKFGGSSLCDANQIKKVAQIIQNDAQIRYVVVSAPGKRNDTDIKVTDLLIELFNQAQNKQTIQQAKDAVLQRFKTIINDLALSTSLLTHFDEVLSKYLTTITTSERLLDALKACGEDFNAQIVSAYLQAIGLSARYISPSELGILVSDEPSNARLIATSYEKIAQYKDNGQLLVIPGFFGYSENGNIVTFPRGGSDITGAIVARGVRATVYENYTDQTYIYAAHPGIIKKPVAIQELTYREMRELAYSGFGIFHDEALEPLFNETIPVMVRNTNQPTTPGTKIVSKRDIDRQRPVVGISCDEGFTAISLHKYLLNRQLGFTHQLLKIFDKHQISIEHIPTGIDDISVVFRSHQLQSEDTLNLLVRDIEQILQPDMMNVEQDLAVLVVVGEGMNASVGTANKATQALASERINIRMINQGASEISMFFTISMNDKERAIHAMYHAFFEK